MHLRKDIGVFCVVFASTTVGWSSSASAEPPPGPGCNGVLVLSLAGTGTVDDLTRQFHQDFKDLGLPPGAFDSATAQTHGATVDDCLGA